MFKFVIFSIFCWFCLCALAVFFICQKRKKTLLLRSFIRMAKNQSPEKWMATENAEGLPRQYSTTIAGFYVVIEKYPEKKERNNDETIYYSHRMSISRENMVYAIFDGWRIAKTYQQVDRERRRTERIIEKWRRSNAKTEKKEALAPA